jgi:hypothetical protein
MNKLKKFLMLLSFDPYLNLDFWQLERHHQSLDNDGLLSGFLCTIEIRRDFVAPRVLERVFRQSPGHSGLH